MEVTFSNGSLISEMAAGETAAGATEAMAAAAAEAGGVGGANGTCAADVQVGNKKLPPDDVPTSTACSWMRLAANLPNKSKPNQLTFSLPTADRWWTATG